MTAAAFVERLWGEIPELFKDENELRTIWSRPDTRKALLEGLAEKGYGSEQLTEISRLIDAEKSDLYDVLAYIAYASAPISSTYIRRTRQLKSVADAFYWEKHFQGWSLAKKIALTNSDWDRVHILAECQND